MGIEPGLQIPFRFRYMSCRFLASDQQVISACSANKISAFTEVDLRNPIKLIRLTDVSSSSPSSERVWSITASSQLQQQKQTRRARRAQTSAKNRAATWRIIVCYLIENALRAGEKLE